MLPSINCERGYLTHNSCFKYSRWHCTHKPLLPLAPGLCLSLEGSGEERGGKLGLAVAATAGINSDASLVVIIHSLSSQLLKISNLEGPGTDGSRAKQDLLFGFQKLWIQ